MSTRALPSPAVFTLVTCLLVALLEPPSASAANTITIVSPPTDQVLSGSTLVLQADSPGASSASYSIDGGPGGALSQDRATGTWRANVDLALVPAGPRNVTVTASFGATPASDTAWRVRFPGFAAAAALAQDPDTVAWGTNYSGAEFGTALPGTLGTDYIYPNDAQRDTYFASRGLRLVRLPITWERLQHQANGPLTSADLAGVRSVLDQAAAAGQKVIVDLHNFGRYYGTPLTVADSPKLANFWQQMAAALKGHPGLYGYELMNEPHDLPEGGPGWARIAQIATDGVRQSDTSAWVLVPGYSWQNATYWVANNPALAVQDSANHLLYSAHLYFDSDYTGQYSTSYDASGAYPTIGVDRVQPFRAWLAAHDARGALTEYGVPAADARWLTVLDNFLKALQSDPHILGGTYWSAGPWWGSYPLSVDPVNGQDRPQMAVLMNYRSR